jgi:hypothetical protein
MDLYGSEARQCRIGELQVPNPPGDIGHCFGPAHGTARCGAGGRCITLPPPLVSVRQACGECAQQSERPQSRSAPSHVFLRSMSICFQVNVQHHHEGHGGGVQSGEHVDVVNIGTNLHHPVSHAQRPPPVDVAPHLECGVHRA